MWNLSLLSRGCGDLSNRKHKRLDVYLEDQDYFNWKAPSKSACVSPKPHNSEDFLHHHCQPVPPKTFSTRRGALVLYSEDLALQSWQHQHSVKWRHGVRVQLSTLQDLAKAILAYGQRENGAGSMQVEPYLHFLIGHRNRSGNRKIRPGYSAKQYLACLAETCDPTLLYRLQRSGYTNKLNQLQGQSVDSLLQQQTKCDLSKTPRPYRANPCLPVADLYQSWPCLDEEDEEEEQGEEAIFDTGECCPATDNEVKGTQSDSSRPGVREILTNRETGAEGLEPQETSLYVLVTVPARDLEQITEEADQVQATQQVFDTPLTSSLNRRQPAKARDQCHSSSLPGRPIIDSSQLCCQRSRGTYYGGPLAGVRRVKGRPGDQCGSKQHVEPPASVGGQLKLPPIGSETGAGLQPRQEQDSSELERWKLPQIQRRSLARKRHAGKRRKGPIPEAARFTRRLILPPLTDVRPRREKGEDIHNDATEIKGKLGSPDSIEDSRMKGLDESTWINEEYPINTEEISAQNGGSVQISENNGQMESEERMVRFITIRIEENGTPLEGKLEASESEETSKMKGLDESTQIKEEYPISTEDRSSQDGGNVGISEEVTQKENEERDLKFIRIRIEENGDLLAGNEGLLGAPESAQNSRVEVLDQFTRINEEDANSTEERSGRNGGNIGISEKNSQREREEREVESNGIQIQENGNLLEEGDDQSQKPGQTLQLMPPIHETRGPVGKRRSKPGLRHKARRTKTSSLDPVRGSVPKELKEVHKNISVGSLLMAPDGEIVHLSWLGPYQCPSNNLMISFSQQQGHRPLECDASGRKAGLITNQESEGGAVNGAVHRDTKHLGDVHIESGDDIVFRSDRESGHSTGSSKRSQRGRARKAFRQGGRRRTDPDGDSSGKSESRSPGGGVKVNSHRRGRVKRQPSEDPSRLQDVVLDEDGNLNSAGSHRSPVSDSFREGEVMRGRRRAARGSGYENSAAIPSLTGWSEPEPSSLSATDELEAMCGLRTVDDGCSPSHRRRSRLLLKDDQVVAVDSGTDAEDEETELWNQQGKGSTGIKAKKESKRNRGQNSPNQDPNAEDSDAMPSSSEELRSSRESNYGAALNKPPGPRRSLRPNQSSGPNNERNRNNERPEFVVGRPREMRARQPQQRHPSQTKQKESSKPVTRKTVRGGGGEEEDAEQSSEEGGPLHSTRTRNSSTSGSTLTAFAAGQDPNSQYNNTKMRDPEKDQVMDREPFRENPGYPQGTTHLPGSRSLRRSGSSSLMEGGDWPQSQEEHSEQRRQEMERRIQQELDKDQRQKEQEISNQRQQRERAILQQREAEQNRQQQEQQSQRREQRQQEEYRRIVQEMQQRKERSLAERAEEEKRLQRERQKEQEEEEELLKAMDEPQRMEYLRLKQIKEEREKEEMEERHRKEGERSRILMQEAMQEAIFLLHQKGLMERDLMFSRNLWVEFLGLERDQNITRPWVFSYFELINFLGLQAPVEEGTEESRHVGRWD